MNILTKRQVSATETWPTQKMNKCVARSQLANQLSVLLRCHECLLQDLGVDHRSSQLNGFAKIIFSGYID